jgi:hypothetical protein
MLDLRSTVERSDQGTSGIDDTLRTTIRKSKTYGRLLTTLYQPHSMRATNEYDFNGNGIIDPEEREIMIEDRRRKMEDADAKRDAQRRMTWFALSGMVLYPLAIILASALGYSEAAGLIADIATVYVVAVSGVTAAYFGFNAMESNK